VPRLQAAGWDTDAHSIAEQRFFIDSRVVVRGNRAVRKAETAAELDALLPAILDLAFKGDL